MAIKVKRMLFGKIAILLSLCFVLNNTFMMKSYAAEMVATENLFIPISTFVTAALIGSGMIAKNSQEALDAGGQLVNKIISQIKSSEVAKIQENPAYNSPYRVIKGGKSEKPNNDNKDGKWVAAAGGALAAHEIYASKDAIKDIMSKANSLGGYKQATLETGKISVTDSNILSSASASNISLQLAKYSNKLVTQFNRFLQSDEYKNWVSQNNIDESHVVYSVIFNVQSLFLKQDNVPGINITAIDLTNVEYICSGDYASQDFTMGRYTFSQTENETFNAGSFVVETPTFDIDAGTSDFDAYGICRLYDKNSALIKRPCAYFRIDGYRPNETPAIHFYKKETDDIFKASSYHSYNMMTNASQRGYAGYKWLNVNPMQFTNNVYNVNMSFDDNFKNWLQAQIQGLGDQVVNAVRLGVTSSNTSWDPNQQQIQAGTSPDNVIYQFINNYQNPETVPDDEPQPEPGPEPSPGPVPEPVPNDEYLGNFLLPESITTKFPFCIPFDVARCLRLFSTSEREAPRWECDLGYGDNKYHVVIDLSTFDDIASFIRPLEYLVFLVGLAIGTRSLIRG